MTSVRRTPVQRRSRERVRLIVDAAANLIAKDGIGALTTSSVAERAGIPVGTLYQYFADRDDIIATLVDEHLETMDARITADLSNVKNLTIRSLVQTAMRSHVEFYRDNPSFVKMWIQGRRLSPEVVAKQRKRNVMLAKWLRAVADGLGMVQEDTPELGAWFVVEVSDRILEMAFRRDPHGDDEIIERGIEMISSYMDRYTTDTGRRGMQIFTLPELADGTE